MKKYNKNYDFFEVKIFKKDNNRFNIFLEIFKDNNGLSEKASEFYFRMQYDFKNKKLELDDFSNDFFFSDAKIKNRIEFCKMIREEFEKKYDPIEFNIKKWLTKENKVLSIDMNKEKIDKNIIDGKEEYKVKLKNGDIILISTAKKNQIEFKNIIDMICINSYILNNKYVYDNLYEKIIKSDKIRLWRMYKVKN